MQGLTGCIDALDIARAVRVEGVSARLASEGRGEASGEKGHKIEVLVKDPSSPSIDEMPLLSALRVAFAKSGQLLVLRPYEKEASPREDVLAGLLRSLVAEGKPFVAIVPSLLAVGLASRLPARVIDALESLSVVVEAKVAVRNLVYLPVPEVNDVIEIVGKKNSAASYDRIRRLEEAAGRYGIKVRGHVLLNSNMEILEYIVSGGVDSLSMRVPVTKLALYILAISRCLDIPITPVTLEETSLHTIYFYGLGSREAEAFIEALRSPLTRPGEEEVARLVERGAAKLVEILSRPRA
ncbi:hypothetical protein apy_15530 [Aeropyrum pernix]|uniref:Uncharacterized protein n=1 Tax=Aeropyrum pernix TaxID=56636 RepID=A0A401HBV4_AERPX|nr:hypothetical protein [Aeropyrum pernix]GBF09828.1 hypothetical protein apy_15530 [Aeropyrum pernix]